MFIRRLLPAWIQPASSTQTSQDQQLATDAPVELHEAEVEDGTFIDLQHKNTRENQENRELNESISSTALITAPVTAMPPTRRSESPKNLIDEQSLITVFNSSSRLTNSPIAALPTPNEDVQSTITVSTPSLTLISNMSLGLEEADCDADTTPLLSSGPRPQTPSLSSYQQLSNYSYCSGVAYGALWGGLGVAFKNLPVLLQFSGATALSAISVEFLLYQTSLSYPDLDREQARKKMLFTSIGATLATNSLGLLIGTNLGVWVVAPLIMIGAKALAPTIEKQLTRTLPQLAANLSSWWNRKTPRDDKDSKKFDLDCDSSKRCSFQA